MADLLRIAATAGHEGPVWSASTDDLALTTVVYGDGRGSTSHINPEFDQILVVLEGEGIVEIAGERYPLHPGEVAYVPKAARRRIQSLQERLVYLTINRKP
ncbi:MAG: cupin domain-containing protein [Dehalococcoidia bacterium]